VRIFRFDEEVSVPVSAFGSDFRIGPLTEEDSRVRVQMMHLAPGGVIGRHPTTTLQMFAVVKGEGEVSGSDGKRRVIRPGSAAVWDAGELHDASSTEGMMAICIEGEFDVAALSVTAELVVSDYDPEWRSWFKDISDYVWPALRDVALRIDHVGATSVPGLAAKPIIDIDVVVASEDGIRPAIDRLSRIGYRWRGDLGISGREAFNPPKDAALPPNNLYLVVEDCKAHMDHWLLRDLLVEDAEARDRYAELKRRNARHADGDLDVYVAAKATFVAELLTRARAERGLAPETYWNPEGPGS
jgi:GrpB-like predicted nucleotidyltransferase (UPF0157 family)/quercetin dioxygenase-like cupin family protein